MVLDLLLQGQPVVVLEDSTILARQHLGPRQTDPDRVWKGKRAFYRKYKRHMGPMDRLTVRMQIAGYGRKGHVHGCLRSFLAYAVHRGLWRVAVIVGQALRHGGGER